MEGPLQPPGLLFLRPVSDRCLQSFGPWLPDTDLETRTERPAFRKYDLPPLRHFDMSAADPACSRLHRQYVAAFLKKFPNGQVSQRIGGVFQVEFEAVASQPRIVQTDLHLGDDVLETIQKAKEAAGVVKDAGDKIKDMNKRLADGTFLLVLRRVQSQLIVGR